MFAGINAGLVFNYTHSAPFGLYVGLSGPPVSDRKSPPYVFFCPDIRWPSMKGEPNYRSPMRTCPDGFSPLIKPVVAWPGDTVETSAQGIAVNGVPLSHTVPMTHDSKGHPIRPYPFGTYRVQPGQLWAVSSFSPRSFDSRYFGPVPERSVHMWVRPWIVEKTYPANH
jgi:conjugative transfer signal peptidase TraF